MTGMSYSIIKLINIYAATLHNQDTVQGIEDKSIRKIRIKYSYRDYIPVSDKNKQKQNLKILFRGESKLGRKSIEYSFANE